MNKIIGKFGKKKVIAVVVFILLILVFIVTDLLTTTEKEFIKHCRDNKNVLGEEMILNMMKDRYDDTDLKENEKHQVALETIYKEELEEIEQVKIIASKNKKKDIESVGVSMNGGTDTSINRMNIQTIVSNKNDKTTKAIYFDIIYGSYGKGEIGRESRVYDKEVKTNQYLETSYKIELPEGWDYVSTEVTGVEFK